MPSMLSKYGVSRGLSKRYVFHFDPFKDAISIFSIRTTLTGQPVYTLWSQINNPIWKLNYRTRAIINRGLYIFYPIFHCGLYCRAVNITDNLCTKKGNSSFFKPKILGLYTRAVTDQKLVIMGRVRYHFIYYLKQTLSAQPTITASYLWSDSCS